MYTVHFNHIHPPSTTPSQLLILLFYSSLRPISAVYVFIVIGASMGAWTTYQGTLP